MMEELVKKVLPDVLHPAVNVGKKERMASVASGGALIAYSLARRNWGSVPLALAGVGFVYRGATGHCNVYQALGVDHSTQREGRAAVSQGVKVERSVTINQKPAELYNFWRQLENLPRFMRHLESVQQLDEKRSHWVAKGPADVKVEWDAEIIAEQENALLSWRSLEGADIPNAGSVRFIPQANGQGTMVKVTLSYEPPAGKAGQLFAQLFGADPETFIAEDLRRFKQLVETGEIATIEGQTSGRAPEAKVFQSVGVQ